jgi:hypothetical protein
MAGRAETVIGVYDSHASWMKKILDNWSSK